MRTLNILLLCQLTIVAHADTLQPLGDEFSDAATFSRYQEHGTLEGWVANHVESANINTSSPGYFRIVPTTTGWYEHLRGTHFSKNVTGDFIATSHVIVYSRQNPSGPLFPSVRLFSLGGILIREPRAINHAAPVPYTTSAVWPPQNFGSDWTPGDETWANTSELVGKGENYIFLSHGTAGNAGTRQFEIKTTRRSRSELYYSTNGVGGSREAWLQIVRVGNTVVCLRKYSEAGTWFVENRYPNADHAFPQFGSTLQVGITAYTDFNSVTAYEAGGPQTQFNANYINIPGQPDLILDVDYLRLQRPDPALTEAMLQGMSVSYNPATNQTANPPTNLTASPSAAPYLGDNSNIPLGSVAFANAAISVNETAGTATLTITRSGSSTVLPLSLNYAITSGTANAGSDFTSSAGSVTWSASDTLSKTIIIPLLNDALAEGSEQFTVNLSTLDGPATFAASAPVITAIVTLEDSPFDQWRAAQFGSTTAANQPNAQPLADFDFDGLANFLEYALGSSAVTPSTAAMPQGTFTSGQLRLSFTRSLTATDLVYEVESSSTLAADSWTTIASKTGVAAWTNTPGVTVSDPGSGTVEISAPGPFLRLRVTRP